jgi:hypothetical protein
MLRDVAGAGILDQAALTTLADELTRRAQATDSCSSLLELARIWRDLERRAGPALIRAHIPRSIELALVLNPLDRLRLPPETEPLWRSSLEGTRRRLLELGTRTAWDPDERARFLETWARRTLTSTMDWTRKPPSC